MSFVSVKIHSSQFPDSVRRDLLESLRTRRVNHKFHYDSIKQTQKWLELHAAFSPSRVDPDCAATYDRSFAATASMVAGPIHLVGLGCGGGQKDSRLLKLLKEQGKDPVYTPSDVSVAMVLVARSTAENVIDPCHIHPLVADLATADDFADAIALPENDEVRRLLTFFGMIPNFQPSVILPRLRKLIKPGDLLLFSANLAPGNDYARGVEHILPLYDNQLTREWLMTFLLDLGVERDDGELHFVIEEDADRLRRVEAIFKFSRRRDISLGPDKFSFAPGESVRLFYSYRHTPATVSQLLARHGITVQQQWITASGEEGVFLCALA